MDETEFEKVIDDYCQLLSPLFDGRGDPFDYVLALLRTSGQDKCWLGHIGRIL